MPILRSAQPGPELSPYVRAFAQRKFDLTDLIVVEPVPAQLEQVLNFELGILPGVRHRYYRRTLTAWPLESTTKAKSWEIHAMPTSAAVPSFGKTIR